MFANGVQYFLTDSSKNIFWQIHVTEFFFYTMTFNRWLGSTLTCIPSGELTFIIELKLQIFIKILCMYTRDQQSSSIAINSFMATQNLGSKIFIDLE